ncbi:nucleotidyltransferase domain-containing protein [Algoriphagus persicinus]|uniref:nucleotidyltransferase domain-containing protein n=1 Tax=Algoriphagus persicinus TaxID=3108754 RepID=UPI002B3EAC2B|nr:nucleotidyltransferase domain-containing protein [Algoriphagus sp. E1-3-M2]MEB2787294.1 nucleotidyltransferase domain-containing protein [Algoriphagus sp. E1-3-M2]
MSSKLKTSNDFGLSGEVFEKIHQVFRNHPTVQKAVLYGSRALGTFRHNSDIDLTLVGERLTFTEQLEIDNELDDLLFPYQIDLSIFHRLDHKGLIDHIERVGKTFYLK